MKRPAPLSQPELDRLKETSDSLREQVYRYINGAMAEGRLKPGDILNQESVCEALKVSRAPLRDALIRLEAEGLITIVPRRGVYINHTAAAISILRGELRDLAVRASNRDQGGSLP